jgi:hypothetical protein
MNVDEFFSNGPDRVGEADSAIEVAARTHNQNRRQPLQRPRLLLPPGVFRKIDSIS